MIDKERLIEMTRLAVYDKNTAVRDRRVNDYFLHDYIYKNNMWHRFAGIAGAIIVIFFYVLHRIFNESADFFLLNLTSELKKMGIFVFGAALFYTLVGSIKSFYDYRACQKRIDEYTAKLAELKGKKSRKQRSGETGRDMWEETDGSYGNSVVYTSAAD